MNYNKNKDQENHYRERLMLFLPWRDEETDLKGNCESFKERYMMEKDDIKKIHVHYEKFNEDFEEAIENGISREYEDISSVNGEEVENNSFGFFDPDRDDNLKQYDIGPDLYIGNKKKKLQKRRYDTEVDWSGLHMNRDEYRSVMQMLNNKQYELCSHVMEQLENNCEQMLIFIEGGAGVGKTLLGHALCETITRFHIKKAGNADNNEHILILAPTGMAAYHIKGTTFHTGLCIPPQQLGKLPPLTHEQRNSLRSCLINVTHIFIDEISMVGSTLAEYANVRLQEIFDCKYHLEENMS